MTNTTKDNIISSCERIIEFFIYLLLFALPFSKAIAEISSCFIIVSWFVKRGLLQGCNSNSCSFVQRLKKFRPEPTYLDLPIAFFIIATFISVIFSNNFSLSLRNFGTKTLEYLMLFYVVAEFINSRKRLENVIGVILVSVGMVVVDCIMQLFLGFDLLRQWPLEAGRITGSFQMPGTLAGYFGPVVCLSLSLNFLRLKNRLKISLRVLSALLLVVLIATFSRGAWFGFLAGLLFLGFMENKKIPFIVVGFLIIAALLMSRFVDLPYNILERIKDCSFFSNASNFDRKTIWMIALHMIKDKPIFGHGLSTFMGNFAKYGQEFYYFKTQGLVPYAHNCYLQIAAETGVVGFLSFMALICMFFFRSVRSLLAIKERVVHAALAGVTAGVIATLVHSLVDTNLYSLQLSMLFWIMLGINAALQREALIEKK